MYTGADVDKEFLVAIGSEEDENVCDGFMNQCNTDNCPMIWGKTFRCKLVYDSMIENGQV